MELQRTLQSLACAKYKVLKKHPPSRDVAPSDSFSFNVEFSAPLQRIKISTIASRVENSEERRETRDRVEEERRHQTEVRSLFLFLFCFGKYQVIFTLPGVYSADYEGPEEYHTQRSYQRGYAAALEPVSAAAYDAQKADRVADRGACGFFFLC